MLRVKNMIKLVVSDIDGTLLHNGNQSLDAKTIQTILTLQEKGLLFAAASGRQYPNLIRLFGPASKDMIFICENGGLILYKDQILLSSSMDRTLGLALIEDIWNREGCEILLSGQFTSYLKPKSEEYYHRMKNIVRNDVTLIEDFKDIKEDFIKISVFEKAGIAKNSGDYFVSKWESYFKCTISGHGWLDFTAPDVNKGNALRFLLKKLSLSTSEVMAFGDNYNDLEMLSMVQYGYVMENAAKEIRDRYSLRAHSVADTLCDYFKLNL
ncbi:haloacid dehalogenase [Anaerocolumna cellulosilytica]|uniref:Haloacid dehalogenase n=2 Tax=Anaerocolumna cellulosilytica TaxID=433286 RepID=A0A6S6QXE5_9FIRM|nr:haloacid dehalogenase [Anaerocolumna cellulosilytica]